MSDPLTSTSLHQRFVLWRPVIGVAAVQGTFTITWVIYRLYLADLLVQFGFPKEFAVTVLFVDTLLGMVGEPVMGTLSDRTKQWLGTQFPLISIGAIVSSALFIAIPTIAILGNFTGAVRWILPGAMMAWAFAMTIVRSPAISLLGQYASASALPKAASVVTLVGGIAVATAPTSSQWWLALGPGFAFALGSIAFLAAVAVLRALHPQGLPNPPSPDRSNRPGLSSLGASIARSIFIFATGIGLGFGFRFLFSTLARAIAQQLSETSVSPVLLGFGIIAAVAALPLGRLASRWETHRGLLVGALSTAVLLLGVGFVPRLTVLALVGLILAFSLVNNGGVPFVLGVVPPQQAGFGVGLYFGGFGAAFNLFGNIFGSLEDATLGTLGLMGALSFLGAGICVVLGSRLFAADRQMG
ncbi:MAG: MFS transporter [Cyanobacteriota bacterium]|nr:MFS transporter [Cyanobacteriota bacterium]